MFDSIDHSADIIFYTRKFLMKLALNQDILSMQNPLIPTRPSALQDIFWRFQCMLTAKLLLHLSLPLSPPLSLTWSLVLIDLNSFYRIPWSEAANWMERWSQKRVSNRDKFDQRIPSSRPIDMKIFAVFFSMDCTMSSSLSPPSSFLGSPFMLGWALRL